MTLHVVYRAAPVGNKRCRPDGFSKWTSLLSLLRSAEACTEVRLRFVCDGPLPDQVRAVMGQFGDVEQLGGLGNSRSYRHVVAMLAESDAASDDIGYLCEDDYLHLPDALSALHRIQERLALGTYVTLYDHPDRYHRRDDLPIPGRGIELFDGRHWRAVESTAMTFGASIETLRSDRFLLDLAARYTRYPHDRAMWRTLQGLGVRRPVRWARRPARRLLSAVPGLATHMEVDALSPGVDWLDVQAGSRAWAAERGLPEVEGW